MTSTLPPSAPNPRCAPIAKGQPFEIVYSLMSKVTLELVVAPSLLEKAGVKPGDPLQKRIAALKGATIGVAAIGGTQETAARWLAAKGGLDPKADIKIAQVGSPPALQAALENKRIDAFVLSPPEGYLATKAGSGTILISLGDEFPLLANQPYLVLVAKKPIDDKNSELIVKTVRAMQAASTALVKDTEPTAAAIQKQFFAKADPDAIVSRRQISQQRRRRRRQTGRREFPEPAGVFQGSRHRFRQGVQRRGVKRRHLDQQLRRARRQEIDRLQESVRADQPVGVKRAIRS